MRTPCPALFMSLIATAAFAADTVALNSGWEFHQLDKADWLPATVPGDVHLDLLANKKIPDPFYRDNEAKLQWIENESWEYRINFDVTPAMLRHAPTSILSSTVSMRRPRSI